MNANDFFHTDDPAVDVFEGHQLGRGWWSRRYEYPWAIQYAKEWRTVADMGCGWSDRPFKNVLADKCEKVYAVDGNEKMLNLDWSQPNLNPMVAMFDELPLADNELDTIFFISVLEENKEYAPVLQEFRRVLKPEGRVVMTFDIQHDPDRPLSKWGAVDFPMFMESIIKARLLPEGVLFTNKENAVVHGEFNLCVYHCILKPV